MLVGHLPAPAGATDEVMLTLAWPVTLALVSAGT